MQNLVIKSSKSIQKASEKQLNNEDVRNLQPNLKVSRERLGLLENTFLCYSRSANLDHFDIDIDIDAVLL